MNRSDLEFFGIDNDSMNSILPAVGFFVEGSSDDAYRLQKEYEDKTYEENPLEWTPFRIGHSTEVGEVKSRGKKYPVYVTFSYHKIGDTLVAFYTSDSRCCDWDMIEEYIDTNYPITYDNGTRTARTNTTNFHHCYGHCREMYNSPFEQDVLSEIENLYPNLDISFRTSTLYIKDEKVWGWREKYISDIPIARGVTTKEECVDIIQKKLNDEYFPKVSRFKNFKKKLDILDGVEDLNELKEFIFDLKRSKSKKISQDYIDGVNKCLDIIASI